MEDWEKTKQELIEELQILRMEMEECDALKERAERKRIEEELLESERRYRRTFEKAHDVLYQCDLAGIILDISPSIKRYSGYDRSEVVGKPVLAFYYYTEDRKKLLEAMNRNGEVIDFEVRLKTKDGRLLYVSVNAHFLFDDSGERTGVEGSLKDVTERVRADEALRNSEEKFRAITTTAADAILVMDDRGRIIYWNPAAERIFGYPAEDALGRDLHLLLAPPDLHGSYHTGFAHFVKTGQGPVVGKTVEFMAMNKDGREFPIEISTSAMNMRGRWHALGIIRDISERYLLEAERMKIQKLEAIGTLAGGIAHDFNNLLQGVFGSISVAKINLDRKEKALQMLEQAEKALTLSINLTRQLLTFSKGGKPVKKKINVLPLIENAVKFALSGSRCDCRIAGDENLWTIEADEGQLSQVIQNIMLNANDAMPEGGNISLQVGNVDLAPGENSALPEGGRFVRIIVRDVGNGIPKEHLQKIFDPYFTTKEQGSGLGLTTSYSIIKHHGGVISVDSEPGRGSTFCIFLPAMTNGELPAKSPPPVSVTRKGVILVMDDDEIVRAIAQEMITSLGHDVRCVENGEEAIKVFTAAQEAGKPFDVVILDLTIRGGMGGQETIQRLLEIDPNLKSIVSSGYAENNEPEEHHFTGFSSILNKPYDIVALRETLSRLLQPSRPKEQ